MKKKLVFLTASMFIFVGVFTILACNKEADNSDEGITDETITVANDDATASSALDDAIAEVDDIGMGSTLKSALSSDCKNVTLATSIGAWPRKISINFGDSCIGKTGRAKSGIINITIGGPKEFRFWYPGTYRTLEFENFKVNNKKVEGTTTVTFKGFNDKKQPYWEVRLDNGKITFKDGSSITRSFIRTRTMTAGYDSTSKRVEGEFSIEGKGIGTNRKGLNYSDSIVTPLTFSHNCKHIKTGEIMITVEGKDPITLKYENKNCSGKAIISKKGKTKEIDLD